MTDCLSQLVVADLMEWDYETVGQEFGCTIFENLPNSTHPRNENSIDKDQVLKIQIIDPRSRHGTEGITGAQTQDAYCKCILNTLHILEVYTQ